MSIESVKIESDEDGFHLIADGEVELRERDLSDDDGVLFASKLDLHLTMGAAVELLEAAMETIAPWHTEGQSVLRDFEHYQKTGERPSYVPSEPEGDWPLTGPATHQIVDEAEALREGADLSRKSRRENA